ncbi:TonB-dependent receptor [Sandarakinorhabdus sp. DWP1-3-1]|uniref:TonB-dependent receptor n=1 Tax=Sandarakinorhabdus sp. DWP1-3-1 TaxID=2804627 RepID=UPI003CFB6CDB
MQNRGLIGHTSHVAMAAALAFATPALAQQPSTAASPQITAAETGSSDAPEIIVTARQRSETLSTTPVSVTAISPITLAAVNARTIQDVAGMAPNVLIQPVGAGPSAAAISIRGISFADIEKSFDPAVGVLIDGVFIGTNTGQLLDFFDIASIEVLRGPQGTLFGRNTIGGVINIRRSRPTLEFGGKVELTVANYGVFQARGLLNVPIIKDVLGVKLFGFHAETNGFYRNVTRNRDEPSGSSWNYGAAILFTPSPSFDALLTLERQTENAHTVNSASSTTGDLVCLVAPANQCNLDNRDSLYTTYTQFPNFTTYRSPAATLEMNYSISDDFKLTSITGWRKNDEVFRQDFDGTSIPFYETIRDQYYRQITQEFRLGGKVSESLDFVAGLYYFNSKYRNHQTTFLGPILGGATAQQFAEQESKSYAAYADVNWAFAPRFRATFGGRYTKDEKSFSNTFPGAFSVAADQSWSKFTPKVSLDFRPNDDLMVYASFSRGYRAGGFNGRATSISTSQTAYDPETVSSYEMGLKTQLFDRTVQFNVAGFYTKYDNKQEGIIRRTPPGSPNTNETVVANVASATIKGIEADVTARPVRGLTLNASAGYLKSDYDSFNTLNPLTLAPIDLSGLSLTFNPSFTASASASYAIETSLGDVTLSANYRHIARYYTAITPDPGDPNPNAPTQNSLASQTRPLNQLDASVAFEPVIAGVKTRLNLYVRNLLDIRGLSANTIVPGLFKTGSGREPRTYGASFGITF